MAEGRIRLDAALAERGLVRSRARARDAILRGHVRVDGVQTTKPGLLIEPDVRIAVEDPAGAYVSRAALKLIAGLDHFAIDVTDRAALDVGASTGGFTQVLLERGVRSVLAIDVGHGQMHPRVADDPRVTSIEGLNARDLSDGDVGVRPFDLVVCDVSFISLKLALPPALALAEPGSAGVFLVKPQFEAGRDAIGRNGLLRDPAAGERVAEDLSAWLGSQPGWRSSQPVPAPIPGGDGNQEYLLAGWKA